MRHGLLDDEESSLPRPFIELLDDDQIGSRYAQEWLATLEGRSNEQAIQAVLHMINAVASRMMQQDTKEGLADVLYLIEEARDRLNDVEQFLGINIQLGVKAKTGEAR